MSKFHFTTPLRLLTALCESEQLFAEILPMLTITTTEAFRDPSFYRGLREKVLPVLHTYPHLRIWVAGCSTGEEVYSLAILLREEGLSDRSTIFATDINPRALNAAREGIYGVEAIQAFTKNYTADYGLARMDPALRENVVFSLHNLVIDQVFTEANLILCRNVLIYFSRDLQEKALRLFYDSLALRGYLALGSKESLRFHTVGEGFTTLDGENKIYQKEPLVPLRRIDQ